MKHLVALVDCNNFYVSCEHLFTVALRNKPVIVFSNNDGCVLVVPALPPGHSWANSGRACIPHVPHPTG